MAVREAVGYTINYRSCILTTLLALWALNVENDSAIQKELFRLTQQSTVPNIFINGRHVGGNSDLQALHQKGELLELVSDGNAAEPKAKL
jgi:glutaredoxin-related protein